MFLQLKNTIAFILFYLDVIITRIKKRLIHPLQNLERKFGYNAIMNNRICDNYWFLMKLNKSLLLYNYFI